MMNKYLRVAILCMTGFTLIVQGCAPSRATNSNNPPSRVQGQPMILQNPPAQVVEATALQQAPASNAAFDGLVWDDLNRNGLQDLNEPGLPNVTVNLFNSAKASAGTAITGQTGAYRFQNVMPGDYYLSVLIPAGYVLSPQDQGENELVDSDNNPIAAETTMVTLVPGENGLVWTTGLYSPTAAVRPNPGTVQPPPTDIVICATGNYSLGGSSILQVKQLAADYCLHAFLWRPAFAIGRIPDDAGRILSDVTFLEIYYQNLFTYRYDVQDQTDSIQVCYAVPSGRQAQIYFFDFYGPRFGQRTGQPGWEPLPTTVKDGVACAVSQTSGAYALIGE